MHYLTCYRCPLKPSCLYHEQVRAAIQNTPGVVFTSVQFKCEYKKGHIVPGARVLVELPGMVEAGPMEPQPFRFHAVVMRWKGRKVQVWLIKPDQCEWPPHFQAKAQAVRVWPDQVLGIGKQEKPLALLCGYCRRPLTEPVTRGTWNCGQCHGRVLTP